MKSNESYRASIDRKANAIFLRRKKRNRLLGSLVPTAGCAALLCAALALFGPGTVPSLPPVAEDASSAAAPGASETSPAVSVIPAPPAASTVPTVPTAPTTPKLPEIPVAALENSEGANRLYYDPAKTYTETWDAAQRIAYLGRDIKPAYLPEGLVPGEYNETDQIIRYNDGAMAHDVICLTYSAPRPDYSAEPYPSVVIRASRIGLECDLWFDWPEDEKGIDLGGIPVRFGLWRSPHYDGGTEPAGYENIYVAEFEQDGVGFQIRCKNLSQEDALRVVCSLVGEESPAGGFSPAGLDSAACA